MGAQLSHDVHTRSKLTETKGFEEDKKPRTELERYIDEERLIMANESLRVELKKKEEKVLYYREDVKLARKVVVEYADALSTIKERERQLRCSIQSIVNQKRMSANRKLKILADYLEQEEPNLIDLSWEK